MRRFAILVVLLLVPLEARARSFCVRQGAAGSGDGSDWTNAYTDLPSSLVRGTTYYVAGGDYGEWTLDDPESGSTLITIKKATDSDHGTDTGWSSSYGTTQAWVQTFIFKYGYYIIDGQTGGGPGSWESGFGIRIHSSGTTVSWTSIIGTNWGNPPLPSHLTFRHIDFAGHGQGAPTTDNDGFGGVCGNSDCSPGAGANYVTVQYCYFHDAALGHPLFRFSQADHILAEYSEFARNSDNALYHSTGMMFDGCNDATIRYNRFVDVAGSCVIGIGNDAGGTAINNGLAVYGNIFYDTPGFAGTLGGGNGVFAQDGHSQAVVTGAVFYNNTLVRLVDNSGVNIPTGGGNVVYDNLWVNCVSSSGTPNVGVILTSASAEDYNTFVNSLNNVTPGPAGANDVSVATGDPFTNSANNDFSLTGPTAPGLNLAAPFNVDMLGHMARADGFWDRGALQYTDGSANSPSSNGSNSPTGDVTAGCACSAGGAHWGQGRMGLLLAFGGWSAWRRWRRRVVGTVRPGPAGR